MKVPPAKKLRYAICIDAGEYEEVDLVTRKIYEVWPDDDAESQGQLRVVDETGDDYLFPASYFRFVTLPPGVSRLLREPRRPARGVRRSAARPRR